MPIFYKEKHPSTRIHGLFILYPYSIDQHYFFQNILIPLILTHHPYMITHTFFQLDILMYLIWVVEYYACQYWFVFL